MLRIGIMLDSYVSSAWVAKTIEDIQASGFARIELVVLNTPPVQKTPSLRKRLRNHWNLALYHRYEQWDYKRNKVEPDAKASTDRSPLLRDVPFVKALRIESPKTSSNRFAATILTSSSALVFVSSAAAF
jgi:hypothetical protein